MTSSSRGKVIGYMAALFVAGLVTGALVGWRVAEAKLGPLLPHPDITAMLWDRLNAEVHLTPEQQKQAEPLVQKTGATMQKMRLDHIEEYKKMREELNKQIEPFLTPEQKKLLVEMELKYQAEAAKKLKLPQPGGRQN